MSSKRRWLLPLGALFGTAAKLRAWLYRHGALRSVRLQGPVISVGNLSVGGSGKTPLVARVAQMLRDEGIPAAILSRGYGGSFRGDALVVSDGESVLADARAAGDEPVMLARSLPGVVVAVGRRRDIVGRAVESRFGRRVHVLDDGFQHLRLARDLDLLCVDVSDLADLPLPAGRLREPPSAMRRADLVLLGGTEDLPPERADSIRRALGPERTLLAGRSVLGFFGLDGEACPAPARPYLLSGIARPDRFESDVRARVAEIAGHRVFPDHHPFTAAEVEEAVARARSAGAGAIVTTAKDAVRLEDAAGSFPFLVLGIAAEVDAEERLRERVLSAARGSAAAGRARARHGLEERAARVLGALVRPLPRPAALSLGRGLGRMLGDLDRRHVAIAVDNLRRAFPDWDESRLLRTARGVYAHFGQTLLDILWLDGRPKEEVLAPLELIGGEHVAAALEEGRGVILATAHIGNWELHGVAHGFTFGPISVLARPLDNPALDRRLCGFRTMGGNAVVYKQRALPRVLRALRAGKGVAILIDQNVQEQDGIFVEFFGRPAATTTVAAALALKTGCPIVPTHTEVRPGGRYRLVYDRPLRGAASGNRGADVARLTQELTSAIEGWIRQHPEQWLWIHRRWKTQPRQPSAISDRLTADG